MAITVDNADAPFHLKLVANGISQRVGELLFGELAITPADAAAYRLSGLSYPAERNLRERALLPYAGD